MQEINDDHFVFSFQKHRKMLSGAREKQIFVDPINQRRATLAAGHAASNSFAALNQVFFVGICLPRAKGMERPFSDACKLLFCLFCKADGFQVGLALAKARRMASAPVPSASSPSIACLAPSAKRCDKAANSVSSRSSKRSPARMASLTFWYRPEVTKPATIFSWCSVKTTFLADMMHSDCSLAIYAMGLILSTLWLDKGAFHFLVRRMRRDKPSSRGSRPSCQ